MTDPAAPTPDAGEPAAPKRRTALFVLPVVAFVLLAALFYMRLGGEDASLIPSALIDKPAPTLTLAPLDGLMRDGAPVPGLAPADFSGQVTLLNVFASWCGPCRQEHPVLMELAKDPRVRVVGLNYKDEPENARRFLGALGNPYAAVGVDPAGRAAIDWGVYGVPETFVVGPDGRIRFKFVGPLTPAAVAGPLGDAITRARTGS